MPGEVGLNADKTLLNFASNNKISVIIVTYNAATTLQNCLDSIYQQTYPNIEIIIIDGKSTDGTLKIIEENSSKIAYYKSEPDDGIYDAMNKATEHITGRWVYFLGADDVLFADFSKLVAELVNNDAIYYGSVLTMGLKRFGKVSSYHMAKTGVFHQAIIYPGKVFKKYKYNKKYSVFADYELNMRCFKDKSIKWLFKDYIIANFNHTGLSGTQADIPFQKDKSRLIFENFGFNIWFRYMIRKAKNRKNPKV